MRHILFKIQRGLTFIDYFTFATEMQDKLCQQANNYDNMRLIDDNVEHYYVDMQQNLSRM